MKAAIAWLKAHHVWHTWGKWERYQYTHTPLLGGMPLTSMACEATKQRRECKVCGRRQSRDV